MASATSTAEEEEVAAQEPARGLSDLADELLELICAALADDYCIGVTSLVRLARSCKKMQMLVVHEPACIARCAAQYNIVLPSSTKKPPFELLAVAETVAGLGTNRIFFQRKGRSYMHVTPQIRPGSSGARIQEFALLLRRHPRLTISIEGHEGRHEGIIHALAEAEGAADGGDHASAVAAAADAGMITSIRASFGQSVQRAEVVRDALLELECLEGLSRLGSRMWGRMPTSRFGPRITTRGWEDSVAEAAGWSGPETCQCEVFFSLDGIEMPSRGEHYRRAEEARQANVGWQKHFAHATDND